MRNTDLVTTAEAALILGYTPEYIRKLARAGRLPIALIVGRDQRLFNREQLEALARQRDEAPQTSTRRHQL